MARNSQPAAEQFAALGLTDPSTWTTAMQLAVKQKWTNLPVDEKVDVLRAKIADTTAEATPSADMLASTGFSKDPEACKVEAARLKRNANVNAWRIRNQFQAALDAREMRFAAMRAARAAKKGSNGGALAATA